MQLNEYLTQLMRSLKELEDLDLFMCKSELSKTEFRLLQEVLSEQKRGNSVISSELARRLGVTRSAVSQIITRLEKKDIVKRIPSQTDRKTAYICLSDYVAREVELRCKRANECMERVAAAFGEERFRTFLGEVDEIAKKFKEIGKQMSAE